MTMKHKKLLPICGVVALWILLTVFAWCKPSQDFSVWERRKLTQFPKVSLSSILSGNFMTDFDSYSLDQFPGRDTFRQVKSLFHYYVLGQLDNNGIAIADGSAFKLDYPVSESSLTYAVNHLNGIYETNLKDTDSRIYFAIVPDKAYYLAGQNGYPAMDYALLEDTVKAGLPWARFIDLKDSLSAADYYTTDTHWRQERILPAAKVLCDAMGVRLPRDFTPEEIGRDFYGVYYGQAALPMAAEKMYTLGSPLLDGCSVYNLETGKTTSVYDMEKLESRDLYDIYLSGAAALLTITNPAAPADRELIVFRDSFGSSMIPLLIADYGTVTVVDTRYLSAASLSQYIDFHGQDVLMLYSTSVLNSSSALRK